MKKITIYAGFLSDGKAISSKTIAAIRKRASDIVWLNKTCKTKSLYITTTYSGLALDLYLRRSSKNEYKTIYKNNSLWEYPQD